jgi:hypothetical protein
MKRSFFLVDVDPPGTLPSSADRTAELEEASCRIIALILSRCKNELPGAVLVAKRDESTGMWGIETRDAVIATNIEGGIKLGGITARFTEVFDTKAAART